MQKSMKKYFLLFVLPTLVAFAIAFLAPFIFLYLYFYIFNIKGSTYLHAAFIKNIIRPFQISKNPLQFLRHNPNLEYLEYIQVKHQKKYL